jgi:tripartite-type tricarboxylate transporter receptor subunit TctC
MKRILAVLLALLTLMAGTTSVLPQDPSILRQAQDSGQVFPSKPVRLVVPFPPGGPLDIAGRLIGRELQDRWGHPVIIENKPGSTIGPEYVVKSAPDGHVLMIISSTPLVTLPHLQKVPYDVLKDLVGVTQTTLLTYALVVNPKMGISSIQELIDRAKKEPGRLNYASAGNGSGQHLYVELLKNAADINLTHVPYKGAAPALQAVLSGEPGIMLDVTVAVMPHVKSGKLRALMVTGAKPLEQLPGAAPFDTLFPGLGIPGWHGIFATGGTPRPVLEKLASDIRQVLQMPVVANRFRELGVEPSGVSGDAFNEIVRRDYARWGEIIRRNNLRAD